MPEIQHYNYANTVKDAAQVQGLRRRNELLSLRTTEAKDKAARQAKVQEVMDEVNAVPARINALAEAGLMKEAADLARSQKTILDGSLATLKAEAQAVDEDSYREWRYRKGEEGFDLELIPVEYEKAKYWRDAERETKTTIRAIDTFVKNAEGELMEQQRIYEDGRETERGPMRPPGLGRATKPTPLGAGITPSMHNSLRRGIGEALGGIWDPADETMRFTDQSLYLRAQSIGARAEELLQSGTYTPAAAEEAALREFGEVAKPKNVDPNDPEGIR